jgi:phenylacetic acid degradation operon negative regulatory protein
MGCRTQDLIFTLYGDDIVSRGGEAWIGSIITRMAELDTSAQAVRSTLSRMTRNGWLRSRREGRHSFYAITAKTNTLLTEGARRIYEPCQDLWDKRWYVLNYSIPKDQRHLRHRLRQRLIWLGNDASQFFQTYAALLASPAKTYVDDVIAAGPGNNVK